VQPVDLAGAHRTQLAPVARDQAQFAQVLRGDEARAHQAEARQHGQPLAVGHVGLAPGDVLDHVGVDDPGRDAGVLQMGVHALPVDAGALHHHQLHAQLGQPRRQRPAVAPKAAELAGVTLHRTIRLLDQDRHHMQHAVHVDAGDAPVQGSQFLRSSITVLLWLKCQAAHRAITFSDEP